MKFDVKFQENTNAFGVGMGNVQILHDGENGATFTPTVSEDGVISWSNNRELENPEPVNIKGEKGEKGDTGAQGVGVKSVTQITTSTADGGTNVVGVTLTDNSSFRFEVKNGSKGSKGDTPIKGTDYFTATDKAEMVKAVKEQLITEQWTFTLIDGTVITKEVVSK